MQNHADRRKFLAGLGIATPAFIAVDAVAKPVSIGAGEPASAAVGLMPDEVFEIYVAESLNMLPSYMSKEPDSNVRRLIESQGMALAAVLAEMQRRYHGQA